MGAGLVVGLVILVVGILLFVVGVQGVFSWLQAGIGGFLAVVGALALVGAAKAK